MTPQITVSQALYDKIKNIAEPFVDTPDTVITRCVDFYISNSTAPAKTAERGAGPDNAMSFPGDAPPDLSFTRIVSIMLEGKPLDKKDLWWNTLLFEVVGRAAEKLKSPDKLKRLLLVNYSDGESTEKGYR